jgi:hypothetical protein
MGPFEGKAPKESHNPGSCKGQQGVSLIMPRVGFSGKEQQDGLKTSNGDGNHGIQDSSIQTLSKSRLLDAGKIDLDWTATHLHLGHR